MTGEKSPVFAKSNNNIFPDVRKTTGKGNDMEMNNHKELVLTKCVVNASTDVTICAVPMQYPVRINDELIYPCNVFENAVEICRILCHDLKGKPCE